jgi:hypothetical protein
MRISMELDDDRIKQAVRHTEILRAPKQSLYTFGTTNIYYYLLTCPVYTKPTEETGETVIREGRVIAQKPRIVTPYYLAHLEGFSPEARRYFEALMNQYGQNVAGLFYTYKNEPKELNIVSDNLLSVVDKLNAEIDKRGEHLAAIIKGEDQLWDVSLLKFIFELTRRSAQDNMMQLGNRGLFNMDSRGIPADARVGIEELFRKVSRGESEPRELKDELDRWGLFDEYEDRFFTLFKK